QFLQTMQGASAEELDEFLVRYNRDGIELNEDGFLKLCDEISLECIETKLDLPWGKENVTLYYGEVPMGESVELLVIRNGFDLEQTMKARVILFSLLVCTAFAPFSGGRTASPQENPQPRRRVILDEHNCYPYYEWWFDRIDRALSAGTPVAIEQDLLWAKNPR